MSFEIVDNVDTKQDNNSMKQAENKTEILKLRIEAKQKEAFFKAVERPSESIRTYIEKVIKKKEGEKEKGT